MTHVSDPQEQDKQRDEKLVYQAPEIIYEGTITTRAGSPAGLGLLPDPDKDANLFTNDE